jgi:hypothetical protein
VILLLLLLLLLLLRATMVAAFAYSRGAGARICLGDDVDGSNPDEGVVLLLNARICMS